MLKDKRSKNGDIQDKNEDRGKMKYGNEKVVENLQYFHEQEMWISCSCNIIFVRKPSYDTEKKYLCESKSCFLLQREKSN
uniref:Uncharacterized protein n=1 Tax=Romanomermis culicivorax TaxID=13658 RepID=A0A915L4N5_ROMCU